MLFADGAFGLLMLGLWIFCIIDVITTPEPAIRNLPKLIWLMIVIVLPDVGSIAWLVAGRNWNTGTDPQPYRGSGGDRGADVGARVRRTPVRTNGTNPDDDEDFLADLRARAEEQRRRARETDDGQPGPATDS